MSLLNWTPDCDVADEEGLTPLHLAVGSEQGGVVKVLLREGADPNKTDERGWTPLHWAAFCCLAAMARLLLDSTAGRQFNRKLFGLSFGLKNGLRDSVLILRHVQTTHF